MKLKTHDRTTTILQFTAGNGPPECAWVVAKIVELFLKDASSHQLEVRCLQKTMGNLPSTVETCTFTVIGASPTFLASWLGTIQWIGKSPIRKFHKRKNWFIGVFEIPPLIEWRFDENEVRYQAFRSSGAGGQHVNKVSTAIRAVHVPTGEYVVAMDSRSQSQNKALALQRLKERMRCRSEEELMLQVQRQWLNQKSIQRGEAVRTYAGWEMTLVKP